MKKIYQEMQLEVIIFTNEDIIKTSQSDNTANMPDFPEDFAP